MLEPINGKVYPMWSQFVEKKEGWIGGSMIDSDSIMGDAEETEITDVSLIPNGTESAMMIFHGKDYDCSFDVRYCGIGGGDSNKVGYLELCTTFGNTFYIKKRG